MRLMPVPDLRGCAACEHVWFTADFGARPCPACSAPLPDVSASQLHVCSAGHSSYLDGECWRCVEIAEQKQQAKPQVAAREWRNR